MKTPPKVRVRRMAWLDYEALSWALAVLKDERDSVEHRQASGSGISEAWRARYDKAEKHLGELMEIAKVRR